MRGNGSSVPRSAGIARRAPAGDGARATADRRRHGSGSPLRAAARSRIAPSHVKHAPAFAGPYDEIDPAFDERGDLSEHVDALATHVRHGQLRRDCDDAWAEAE